MSNDAQHLAQGGHGTDQIFLHVHNSYLLLVCYLSNVNYF